MIDLFNRALFTLTKYVAWLGMVFLMGAMAVTTVDVVMRKVDGAGIFGAVDLVQLMIMNAAYLSIPHAFMSRSHVAVSILTDHFSPRGTALCQVFGAALASGLMFAIAYFGYSQAAQQQEYGDVSLTLGVPMIYYWMPLLFGTALSAVAALHIAVESLYSSVTGHSGVSVDGA